MTQSSCLCGSNVITYNDSAIVKFRCHCTDERKLTGAAFALNILFKATDLRIIRGNLSARGTSTGYPGLMVIKAGCIDLPDGRDPSTEYIPDVEIFTGSRVPWVMPIATARQDWGDFTSL
ncbi:uncharacterized protein RSE6_09392 [Rhynchosporium secalis]|uniref:CENP-V/GFA domain-containing protein n=1 Tax=Rhynchosporium secalis TaxID=38038 RepID=A0A1E1MHS9_RHYSE|nr:uncharacterized protein RSE6_09392 [Rhynchosporium secalis]